MGTTEACGIKASQNSFRICFLLTVACKNAMHPNSYVSLIQKTKSNMNVTTLNNSNGATGERLTIIIYN